MFRVFSLLLRISHRRAGCKIESAVGVPIAAQTYVSRKLQP